MTSGGIVIFPSASTVSFSIVVGLKSLCARCLPTPPSQAMLTSTQQYRVSGTPNKDALIEKSGSRSLRFLFDWGQACDFAILDQRHYNPSDKCLESPKPN